VTWHIHPSTGILVTQWKRVNVWSSIIHLFVTWHIHVFVTWEALYDLTHSSWHMLSHMHDMTHAFISVSWWYKCVTWWFIDLVILFVRVARSDAYVHMRLQNTFVFLERDGICDMWHIHPYVFWTHLSIFVTRWFMCAFMFRTSQNHWLIRVCGRTLSYIWQRIVHMWSMIFIDVFVLHCTHTYVCVHT